ncbi:MAG: MG2 domain-containing protein [Isosphaeraceae bacterium]|nr:MG2 domain-containing protein [Isosphaeraceae bacterium]
MRIVLASTALVAAARGDDAPPPAQPKPAARVIEPAAPVLPAEIVSAMQSGEFKAAAAAIDRLRASSAAAEVKEYLGLIKGIAERLAGDAEAARATFRATLAEAPKGRWGAKIRHELVGLDLAAGRFAAAEEIARGETVALLAGERKDRLAGVYHAFARRLLQPDDPIVKPDPAGAYALLAQARSLAKSEKLRAELLLAMGSAMQTLGKHAEAARDLQLYLSENPQGIDRPEVAFRLGESQLALGQSLPARLTWTDLAANLGKEPGSKQPKAAEFRAKAMSRIAATHGFPNPPDDTQLNLGVAAARRFLAAYPADPASVRASFEIASALMVRGKSEDALRALETFLAGKDFRAETESARKDLADLTISATYLIPQILQGQGKFLQAIEGYKGYLAKFPNGPHSATAQFAILDSQLAEAQEKLRRREFEAARTIWNDFVTKNPLDARVPQLLYLIGESRLTEERPDDAIASWDAVLSRFPSSEPAAHAQFQIAEIYEKRKGDPAAAIERYRKVQFEPWRSNAALRIAVMESRELTVVSPKVFRSGEKAHLKISTRNLESLTFTAYKLNAETFFRKKQQLGEVASLDVGLVAPDAEWTVPVKDYGKYKPIESLYDLDLKLPGVFVVKVSDEKHLRATTLVVGSDVEAIVKASREQVLVFAQDMKTGKGRPNARVLVSDGQSILLEKTTGADGVLLANWETPRDPNSGLRYLVIDGGSVAGSGLGLPGTVAVGLSPRAYLYTDRPAYRPGDRVELRGVVREVADGQYANPADAVYRLEVFDARGRTIVAKQVTLSKFGTFHEGLDLDSGAPVGGYRIRLHQPGKSEFAGGFEVQSYRLERLDLSFDLPRTVWFRGETIRGKVLAKYQYGAPAAGRAIQVVLPDGRMLSGRTDAAGTFAVEFPTEGFAEEQALRLIARMPEDNVAAVADLALAVRAFRIDLSTARSVFLDGETFALRALTLDTQGEPSAQNLKISVLKRVEEAGRTAEVEVSTAKIDTDAKTGAGVASLSVADADGGTFVLRASGTDRFGNAVVADQVVTISGKKDETKLRILAERQTFKVGEKVRLTLHSRLDPGTALLAWEADRVLSYRLVDLKNGENAVEWEVDGPQFPNFTLTAAKMTAQRFDTASIDLKVERDLRVAINVAKPTVAPGEKVVLEVTTVDQLGRPVAAEVAVGLVDRSLLRLFGDKMPEIGTYFYNQTRTGSFTTTSTNTFVDHPPTEPVEEAVVEEEQMAKALAANAATRLELKDQARKQVEVAQDNAGRPNGQVFFETPAPAPAAPAPASAAEPVVGRMMGGGFGGMPGGGMPAPVTAAPGDPGEVDRKLDELSEEGKPGKAEGGESMGLEIQRAKSAVRRGTTAAPAQPRRQFVETAYWNPSIVTGADGKARVEFPAPAAMSSYRFTARGTSANDTLVGQGNADLVVRQAFFVDIKAPSVLTQGDRPRFVARLHHQGVTGKAEATFTTYAAGRKLVAPKTVDITADGVTELAFEPFDVPEGDVVRLTLEAKVGTASDDLVVEIPIRPWGVQAIASASGSSSDPSTVFVGLPPGRSYDSPEMLIVVAPSVQRMLIETALGRDAFAYPARFDRCILPPIRPTVADRASELLGLISVSRQLARVQGDAPPEAARLSARAREIVSELVTLQGDDGGWPWVVGAARRPSDPFTSARACLALHFAADAGMVGDPGVIDRSIAYMTAQFAKLGAGDQETRAAILHALSVHGRASFELANSLNRVRGGLDNAALAYLALTMIELDRASLAVEILDILAGRAKTEKSEPGRPARVYWEGSGGRRHTSLETTALVAWAFALARPADARLAPAREWLLSKRVGIGWQPLSAKGPILAALAAFRDEAQPADDRYRLAVKVNDEEVYTAEVQGVAAGKAIVVPRKALKLGDPNRIRFEIEGRGTYSYTVTLAGFTRDFGPDQRREGKTFLVGDRSYLHAAPELDGRTLPTGFSSTLNAQPFANKVTNVGLGGRASVQIDLVRNEPANRPVWERPALIVEETLPAGTTLIEGSIRTSANSFEIDDDRITFFFAPDQYPGSIQYEVFGYLPGTYRSAPTIIRNAYEPGTYHLGEPGDLVVRSPGEPDTDAYRATPDELLARGKTLFDAGRLAEAGAPLEELSSGFTLRDEILVQVARMLLTIHIKDYQPRKVVQDFEILKEKAPDVLIPFDEVAVVGRAYRDIGEHERAYLVWRAIVEASYLEDARVGGVLRERGKSLDAVAYLIDLWREYPNSPSIETDFFALSQLLVERATKAISDPALRAEMADAGVTRTQLLVQSMRMIQVLLSQSPKTPLADEAALALVGVFLELEDFDTVVSLAGRFAKLYPKSTFLDAFQYSEAFGDFNLGKYDQAIELAEKISKAVYKNADGVEQPSPNKWQAIYILGQIHDARKQPAKAVEYYRQVADRFTDAAGAEKSLTRKDLVLPEISIVRPAGSKPRASAVPNVSAGVVVDKPLAKLGYRNVAEAEVKVYPVDLMRLYLTRRNLDAIAGIDLAGITPLHESKVELGDGNDFEDRLREIDLPLTKEGAYLVMIRGGDLYASGIILVSPLEVDVLEEPESGRVRVTVRDAKTQDGVPKVQVKVIGSNNPSFISGATDLRGVFVAEGVRGQVTAVARRELGQYAFYRGTRAVGPAPAPTPTSEPGLQQQAVGTPAENAPPQSLDYNLKSQGLDNRMRQMERLENRYNKGSQGITPGAAK